MTANSVHGVVEIIKILREESRRSVKKEITAYDLFEYVSSEIFLFGKNVPIIAVKAKDGLPVPDGEKYLVPWVLDNQYPNCMRCNCAFTVFGRRHHCRSCGYLVCKNCTTAIASGEFIEAVKIESRICLECHTNKGRRSIFDPSLHVSSSLLEASFQDEGDNETTSNDGWQVSRVSSPANSTKSGILIDAPESSPQRASEMANAKDNVVINNNSTIIQNTVNNVNNDNSTNTTIVMPADLEKVQTELSKKSNELEAQRAEQAKLLEDIEVLRTKLSHRKQMVLEGMEKIQSLEGTIKAQGSELGILRDQLDKVKVGISPEKGVSGLKTDIDLLQAALAAKDSELEVNQQELLSKEVEIKDLQAKKQEIQQQLEDQQTQHTSHITKLQNELKHLTESLATATSSLVTQENIKNAETQHLLQEHARTIHLLTGEKDTLQKRVQQLENQTSISAKDIDILHQQIRDLEVQLQQLQVSQQQEKGKYLAETKLLQDQQASILLARDLDIKHLQEENTRLREEGERNRQMMGLATDEQLTKLTAELAARDASLTKLQVLMSSRDAELQTLKAEAIRTKETFMADAELQTSLLIQKEGVLTQTQIALASRETEVKKWREEYEKTTHALQAITQEHSMLMTQNETDIQRLKDLLAQRTLENDRLQEQYKQKATKYEADNQQLADQLAQTLKDHQLEAKENKEKTSLLTQQISTLQESILAEQQKQQQLEETLALLKESLVNKENEYRQQLATQKSEAAAVLSALQDEYKAELQFADEKFIDLQTMLNSLQEQLDKEKIINHQLEEEKSQLNSLLSAEAAQRADLLSDQDREIQELNKRINKRTNELVEQFQQAVSEKNRYDSEIIPQQKERFEEEKRQLNTKYASDREIWLSEISSIRNELEYQRSEWEAEKQTLLSTHETALNNLRESLQSKLNDLIADLQKKTDECATISTSLASAEEQRQVLQGELDALRTRYQDLCTTGDQTVLASQHQFAELQQSKDLLQQQLMDAQTKYRLDTDEHKSQLSQLQAQLSEKECTVGAQLQELQRVNSEKVALDAEIAGLRQEYSSKSSESSLDLQQTRSELQSLQEKYARLQEEQVQKTAELTTLQAQHIEASTTHTDSLAVVQAQVSTLETTLQEKENTLQEEKRVHRAAMRTVQDSLALKEQELRSIEDNLTKLQTQWSLQEQELLEIKESTHKSNNDQAARIHSLESLLSETKSELQGVQNDSMTKTQKIVDLEQELSKKRSELDVLHTNMDSERASFTSQMSYQSALLSAKDADLAMGQSQLATREIEYGQLSSAFSLLQAEKERIAELYQEEIASKERQLRNKEQFIEDLQEQLVTKDTTVIQPLKDDIAALRALLEQTQQQHAQELEHVEADFISMENDIAHYKEALDLAMIRPVCEDIAVQTSTEEEAEEEEEEEDDEGGVDGGEDDDLLLHVPATFDPLAVDNTDAMSHLSDDNMSIQSFRSTNTSNTASSTKRNFILENKNKLAKLNSAMKNLTNKSSFIEPSSTSKAKTANKELFSPSSSRKSVASTPSKVGTPSPDQKTPSKASATSTTTASTGKILRRPTLNYIEENKTEVKRTSEGVGLLKKQSQQNVTTRDGTVVTASVGMSTQTLAVLKQTISHETHAEFVSSNYRSLGDLDGERLRELATKASMGDLRLMMTSTSTTAATAAAHEASSSATAGGTTISSSSSCMMRRKSTTTTLSTRRSMISVTGSSQQSIHSSSVVDSNSGDNVSKGGGGSPTGSVSTAGGIAESSSQRDIAGTADANQPVDLNGLGVIQVDDVDLDEA